MSTLPDDNTRTEYKPPRANSVEYLIVIGLGYCCEAFFWKRYFNIPGPLIAARLGVRNDTIRHHKQWYSEGRYACKNSPTCLATCRGLK